MPKLPTLNTHKTLAGCDFKGSFPMREQGCVRLFTLLGEQALGTLSPQTLKPDSPP